MPLRQHELQEILREWNFHRISPCKKGESPGGVPELLYYMPEIEGLLHF